MQWLDYICEASSLLYEQRYKSCNLHFPLKGEQCISKVFQEFVAHLQHILSLCDSPPLEKILPYVCTCLFLGCLRWNDTKSRTGRPCSTKTALCNIISGHGEPAQVMHSVFMLVHVMLRSIPRHVFFHVCMFMYAALFCIKQNLILGLCCLFCAVFFSDLFARIWVAWMVNVKFTHYHKDGN